MALTKTQKAKRNYNYGALNNGNLEYAPYFLQIGNRIYINAKRELYLQEGWKYIEKSDEFPNITDEEYEQGYVIETVYSEDKTTIYTTYRKVLQEV